MCRCGVAGFFLRRHCWGVSQLFIVSRDPSVFFWVGFDENDAVLVDIFAIIIMLL